MVPIMADKRGFILCGVAVYQSSDILLSAVTLVVGHYWGADRQVLPVPLNPFWMDGDVENALL